MSTSAADLPTLMRESVTLTPEGVRILDRRTFPLAVEFVDCADVEAVARAIEDMVTQSGGPYLAASAGLVLAAREADRLAGAEARMAHLQAAAHDLLHHLLLVADELALDGELAAGRLADGRQQFVVLCRPVGRRLHQAAHLPLLLGVGGQGGSGQHAQRQGDERST